jgi:hypothetical protein
MTPVKFNWQGEGDMHRANKLNVWSVLLKKCLLVYSGLYVAVVIAAEPALLFEPIRSVLQHPRCQNCHIPGDQPLQYDQGKPHAMLVQRGMAGKGMPAMECSSCHQEKNSPPVMGMHAPPGAPHWQLPPPENKMVFIGLSPKDLCMVLKDPARNGGRDGQKLISHFADDKLVAWGWNPGGNRTLPPLTKAQTVTAVKQWVDAGMPCPA